MKIQDLNFGTKLLTVKDGKIKVFKDSHEIVKQHNIKYIYFFDNGNNISYNKNKKIVAFIVRQKTFSVNNEGLIIWKAKDGIEWGCNFLNTNDNYNKKMKEVLPKTVINKAMKIYNSLIL